ncbi:hypothetical protein T492DRAFT_1081449 [Pavlovales sp. CCMP2436]|nr:hypothetical protein T492DRAFT_1081449 [Pavlovales sp. CCMP2436]
MSSRWARCCPCAFHEEVDERPPRKAGALTKQGDGGRRRWVERWFSLDDRRFLYREGESGDGPVRQAVELTPSCTAEVALDEEGVTVLVVTIPHADLSWYLRPSHGGGLPELRAWQAVLVRAIRPRWTDNRECNVCQGRFGLIRWRHHCRRCGFCVCRACSTSGGDLSSLGYDGPTTACSLCVASDGAGTRGGRGGADKLPADAITLRLGGQSAQRAAARSERGSREPLLGGSSLKGGAGPAANSALSAAASAFSSLLPAVVTEGTRTASSEGPPVQTHAERIRIKYGIQPAGGPRAKGGASELTAVAHPSRPEAADDHQCVVCLDQDAVMAALPCGHRCLCVTDSQKLGLRSPCPVCRQTIQQFQRIY